MSRPYPTIFEGDIFQTTNGEVVVRGYINRHEIAVEFKDGTVVNVRSGHLREGNVKNPNRPHIFGVGYMGVGRYKPTMNNTISREYELWRGMLRRCYDPEHLKKRPTYVGCYTIDEWFNFQEFAKYYENLKFKNADWELDKDILQRGNRLYSPDTCVMLPSELNKLLSRSKANRGPNPIGVCYNKRVGKYGAYIRTGEVVFLGYHMTVEAAFSAYKTAKEKFIKQQANKWKSQIDPRAYEALMNYEVLITD